MRTILLTVLMLSSWQVYGTETTIEMLNRSGDEMMVFSKPLVHVNIGDSVLWKATDKTHSVAFVKGGVPTNVAVFKSPFNQDARYVFKSPGIYVYKCVAHYGMGMIGMVVVGEDQHNLPAVQALDLMPAPRKKLNQVLKVLRDHSSTTSPAIKVNKTSPSMPITRP